MLMTIGTPNGIATSFFLVQHKAELGNLGISGVAVFLPNSFKLSEPAILYALKNLDEDDAGESEGREGIAKREMLRVLNKL